MLKYHNDFFQITIDGPPALHDKYRPGKNDRDSYDTIIGNLRKIRDNVKSRLFKVVIRINVSREYKDYYAEHIELLKKEFVHDRRFRLYIQGIEILEGPRTGQMNGKYPDDETFIEKVADLAIANDVFV